MKIGTTPWDEIRNPDMDYNVRRVSDSGDVPLYWGKDTSGHCLFVVKLAGDHVEQFRKDSVSVHGIDVDLRGAETNGNQRLILTLEQQVDKDLFMKLCETLTESLRPVTDASTALRVTLEHIKRWKAFLAGRHSRLLSSEEIRGLFGELTFLRSLYKNRLDNSAAVDAWCGAEGTHQDFIFSDTAVEVKTLSGKERNTVRISSEDQLEALCENLFLLVYRLADLPDSDQSLSLNGLVQLIQTELTDAEAIEELSKRLAAFGYVEMREYDKPEFCVTAQKAYRITDEFPRLVRSGLPDGLVRLSYEIELEKIETFECDLKNIQG